MTASREVREEALIRYAKDVLSHPLHFSPTIVIRAKKILHKHKAHLEPHIYGSLNPSDYVPSYDEDKVKRVPMKGNFVVVEDKSGKRMYAFKGLDGLWYTPVLVKEERKSQQTRENPCCVGDYMYNPPVWAERSTWRKAESAVEPYWKRYETPYAVVADVYKKMGGKVMKRRKRRGNPELLMVENPRKKRRRGRGRFHCHYGRKPSYFAFVRKMWKKHGKKLRRMRSMRSRMKWIGATYRKLLK